LSPRIPKFEKQVLASLDIAALIAELKDLFYQYRSRLIEYSQEIVATATQIGLCRSYPSRWIATQAVIFLATLIGSTRQYMMKGVPSFL
jgi:hypothetical protein